MSARLGLMLIAPLFVTATAHAQAPGEVTPESVPPQPVASDPCGGGSGRNVMAHRFAVGVNIGGLSVGDAENEDADPTNFRTAELSIRYRISPRFELELLMAGGRQVLEDDTDGDLAMGGVTLGARYRFRPQHAWNWWLMGGLGGTVIERHDSTEQQRDDATRPHLAFGIGVERRFRRLALHAEARMMALGPREDAQMGETDVPVTGGMPLPPTADVQRSEELSGGTFTLGASFYF